MLRMWMLMTIRCKGGNMEAENPKVEDDDVKVEEGDDFENDDAKEKKMTEETAHKTAPHDLYKVPSQNACQNFSTATLYGHLQEKWQDPHCAENAMITLYQLGHSKCMSTCHQSIKNIFIFYMYKIYKKNAVAQIGTGMQTKTLCERRAHVKCRSNFQGRGPE